MNQIADIFKSELQGDDDTIEKGGKKGKKKKDAKNLGNEPAPHKGADGGQVDHPRGGKGGIERQGSGPDKSKVPVTKAMFPVNTNFRAVSYTGIEQDNALAKSIEQGGEDLHRGSRRNLQMEQESKRVGVAKSEPTVEPEAGSDDADEADDSDE